MAKKISHQHSCAASWVKGSRGDTEGRGARCSSALPRGRARHEGVERSRFTLSNRTGQPFVATRGGALRQPSDRAREIKYISPLPAGHPLLAEVHERLASEHLQRLDHAQMSSRVRGAMIRHLSHGEPRRAEIASALKMSGRTLQRHLEGEGTTFERLLDDTRRELAQQYLGQTDVSLADATYLLGFRSQSSFFRACKRWFGTSPRHYRIRLMQARRDGS